MAIGFKKSQPAEVGVPKRGLRAMTSALTSRFMFAVQHGLQFNGDRDLYAVFGYKAQIEYRDCIEKYIRGDIARRIVNAYPAATWTKGVKVDGGPSFNTAWEELVETQRIWNRLERLDRLCGLGRYAIMVFGYGDKDLSKPVSSSNDLLYTTIHSEASASITSIVSDPTDPRFGLPEMYEISILDPANDAMGGLIQVTTDAEITLEVHHTRILHVAEDGLEDDIIGIPRMAAVYNRLDDLDKVVGGAAETYWLAGNRGIHADIDKEMELDSTDEANLSDELEEYQHQLRRIIRTRGVNIQSLGSDVANPKQTFEVIVAVISGATGIPQRILLGSEAGHLASEQDRANWADRVDERRADFAEPVVLRPFIGQLVLSGVLPTPVNLTIKWPASFSMSPLEGAQVMAQKGRAVANLVKQYDATQPLLSPEESRDILGLEGSAPPPNEPDPEPTPEEDDNESNGVTQTPEEAEEDENGRTRPEEDEDTNT